MKHLHKLNNKGFTLIEVMLVLSIVIIISSISLLELRPLHESKKMDQFLEQLQNDIFLGQQFAISHSEGTTLYFSSSGSFYRITRGNTLEEVIHRKIDPAIRIQFSTLGYQTVFTSNGNIQRSGEIRFKYKESTYLVTFLLGKGRFYVTEK
ncbi:competence type IV pilus minor pilin ComGD [Bacillus sp. REN16]|uniref:competence type IV pilus minor pilin ComGD n=1 Tax=Bacillus sp. REN16 TaxID=2887296 RepID=UPI001E56B2CF|nr:competence type IV pilus minor pilin ComGD [Bacillus sp. REN16]MCC3356741.1 prepilin-type N-terminal cleavage/methylation domain-containing protein [Bacillus sp. REN16]